ncbi:MAG: SDR family NAD(P)-dependent oxidoreductase [Flavobacteriaceae bacterium]
MKTILITGSTDGIGKLTALKLAREGHQVYLHGRNAEKLATTISEVKDIAKNEDIKGYVADFSDLDSVKHMAQQISNDVSHIDILINNAGVYKSNISQTKNGVDIRFAVNYFAPYVLTRALLPLLQNGQDTRLINLSSAAQSAVSLEALLGQESISVGEAYAQSKLALTMWSFHMAKSVPDITVIAVNPGSLLNTKMVKEAFGNHWSPADKGVDILYELALSEDHKDASGTYFDNDKGYFGKAHPEAYNKREIDQLIQVTDTFLMA